MIHILLCANIHDILYVCMIIISACYAEILCYQNIDHVILKTVTVKI